MRSWDIVVVWYPWDKYVRIANNEDTAELQVIVVKIVPSIHKEGFTTCGDGRDCCHGDEVFDPSVWVVSSFSGLEYHYYIFILIPTNIDLDRSYAAVTIVTMLVVRYSDTYVHCTLYWSNRSNNASSQILRHLCTLYIVLK